MRSSSSPTCSGPPGAAPSRTGCPRCARSSTSTSASSTARTRRTGAGSRRSSPTGCSRRARTWSRSATTPGRASEILPYLDASERVIRPANLGAGRPGRGLAVAAAADGTPVAVVNLLGWLFLDVPVTPFEMLDELVEEARRRAKVVIVDFHAEATSEKIAVARLLDGRVTAVLGTHTHVQTNDARVLPGGTAAITDAGMTGPHDSVIGVAGRARDPAHAHRHAGALPPRERRRPHRGRRRRVRRRRPRDELPAAPRPGRVAASTPRPAWPRPGSDP